jgi:hypothetical protein
MFPRRIHMSRVMRVYACKNCLTFHHLLTTNSKIIKVVGKCLLIVLANNHGKCLFHTSRIFSLHGHDEQLLLAVSKKTFIISCNSLCIPSLSSSSPWLFFLQITQYIGDTHNARTLIPMNTRTQTLPIGASSKTVPANPQDWRVTTGVSLSTGTSPTTESTNAVKSWEIRSHGESNPRPKVLPGLL